MAELTGSSLQFSDGSHLGGAPFSYVAYTTNNISCTSSSWVDSWNTGNFLIPAGSFFRVLVYTPTRQDSGQWGGHYFRFYWQINDDGTWRELGHSGYGGGDNSMTHQPPSPGQGRISHYENDFMFDFTDKSSDFNIRFLFQHLSHTTTTYANNANNYNTGNSTYTGSVENIRQKICIWGCGNRRS